MNRFNNSGYRDDYKEEKRNVGRLYTSARTVPIYNFEFTRMNLEERMRREYE